jgi:hypothetical protein
MFKLNRFPLTLLPELPKNLWQAFSWSHSIKVNLKTSGYGAVDSIQLVQVRHVVVKRYNERLGSIKA